MPACICLGLVLWTAQAGATDPEDEPTCEPTSCEQMCAGGWDRWREPVTPQTTLTEVRCAEITGPTRETRTSCVCSLSTGLPSIEIGDDPCAGADGCVKKGRAGQCLMSLDEFEGCNPNDDSTCDAICGELEARIRAEEQWHYDVSTAGQCKGASCDCSHSIDACYDESGQMVTCPPIASTEGFFGQCVSTTLASNSGGGCSVRGVPGDRNAALTILAALMLATRRRATRGWRRACGRRSCDRS